MQGVTTLPKRLIVAIRQAIKYTVMVTPYDLRYRLGGTVPFSASQWGMSIWRLPGSVDCNVYWLRRRMLQYKHGSMTAKQRYVDAPAALSGNHHQSTDA